MSLKGRYINLDKSAGRKEKLERHLEELGINSKYQRFSALVGNKEEADRAGLNQGELGLWNSWISLLNEEIESSENYKFLHIIEDDAIFSKKFINFIERLPDIDVRFDILFTDMHVNPNIYEILSKDAEKLYSASQTKFFSGLYTGCTSSCILMKDRLKSLRDVLTHYLNTNDKYIPLYNYLSRLCHKKEIDVISIIPFLTSIDIEESRESTIQKNNSEFNSIGVSKEICTLLRRDLSYVTSTEDTIQKYFEFFAYLQGINGDKTNHIDKRRLIRELAIYAERNKLLRYRYSERLEGEPKNPQGANQCKT